MKKRKIKAQQKSMINKDNYMSCLQLSKITGGIGNKTWVDDWIEPMV